MAYLGPHNGSYLCRAVFNPINVRIHLLLSPLPTPNTTRTGQKSGSIWIFRASSYFFLFCSRDARRKVNQNYKGSLVERQSQLKTKIGQPLLLHLKSFYERVESPLSTVKITFTTLYDFAITDICFSQGKIGLVVSKKERQQSNNLSNTWQPRSRGRLNKCPRLFHPCFGLIHSEYGTQLIRN